MSGHRCLPRLIVLFLIAFSLARAEEAAHPAAPSGEAVAIIADLRTNLPNSFSGGTWQGKVVTTKDGCAVLGAKGADGKGEVGQTLQPHLDLTAAKYVEVALATAPKNEVPSIVVAFTDVDDIQYTASIRVDELVPGQPVWLRAKLSDFKLNDWKGDKTGRRINWAKIKQWHLQGDWHTEGQCQIVLIALRSRQ